MDTNILVDNQKKVSFMEKISPGRYTREFREETVEPYSRFLNCALCRDWSVMKNAFRTYRY